MHSALLNVHQPACSVWLRGVKDQTHKNHIVTKPCQNLLERRFRPPFKSCETLSSLLARNLKASISGRECVLGRGYLRMAKRNLQKLFSWRDGNVAYDLDAYEEEFIPGISQERRSGLDRRQFTYAAHIPERRRGRDRRRTKLVEV